VEDVGHRRPLVMDMPRPSNRFLKLSTSNNALPGVYATLRSGSEASGDPCPPHDHLIIWSAICAAELNLRTSLYLTPTASIRSEPATTGHVREQLLSCWRHRRSRSTGAAPGRFSSLPQPDFLATRKDVDAAWHSATRMPTPPASRKWHGRLAPFDFGRDAVLPPEHGSG